MPTDRLLKHLCKVAREARLRAGVTQARIAAELNLNQETIARFERGQAWPRSPFFVMSYADCVGVPEIDLWEEAIRRWREAERRSSSPPQ